MTKSKAAEPAIAPNYPNAVIDFDTVHANDAKGKKGDALFEGALVTEPAVAKPAEPATKPTA